MSQPMLQMTLSRNVGSRPRAKEEVDEQQRDDDRDDDEDRRRIVAEGGRGGDERRETHGHHLKIRTLCRV